jgi:L-alanine-DL-glutamate epimerase-like enolase superfamily enzyme
MRITALHLHRLHGILDPAWHWAVEKDTVHPLHIYDDFRRPPAPPPERPIPIDQVWLEIEADGGASGWYGPLYEDQALVVATRLRPALLGRTVDPADDRWDLMYRLDRHLQTGLGMMAISAVDNALWDLRGRAAGQPVCRLLAGNPRSAVPAYRTTNDYPHAEAEIAAFARDLATEGWRHQKWFLRHGPGSGAAGVAIDGAMLRTVRKTVGPDVDLMTDAFMSWDLDHARAMAPVLLESGLRFLEEPFPPARIDLFRALRAEFPTLPLATGEHRYTRWEFTPFLDEGLLAVLQPDPDWCGGITETRRIIGLARARGVEVIPHGHTLAAALHLVAAEDGATCPLVEVLPRHQRRMQHFLRDPIVATDGAVAVPTAPGLGFSFDEDRIERREEIFA